MQYIFECSCDQRRIWQKSSSLTAFMGGGKQLSNALDINVCLDNGFVFLGAKIRSHSTEHLTISYLQFKLILVHSTALFNELMQLLCG